MADTPKITDLDVSLDLTPQRLSEGDTRAFILKQNTAQEKLEVWAGTLEKFGLSVQESSTEAQAALVSITNILAEYYTYGAAKLYFVLKADMDQVTDPALPEGQGTVAAEVLNDPSTDSEGGSVNGTYLWDTETSVWIRTTYDLGVVLNAEIASREQSLAAETLARTEADQELQTALQGEGEARTAAVEALASGLDEEIAVRTTTSQTLQEALDLETQTRAESVEAIQQTFSENLVLETEARGEAFSALGDALTAEALARQETDATLRTQLDDEGAFANGAHSDHNTAGKTNAQADVVDQLGRVILSLSPDLSFKAGLFEYIKASLGSSSEGISLLDKYNQEILHLDTDGQVKFGGVSLPALKDSLGSETLSRTAADTLLTEKVNAETAARVAANLAQTESLETEASARAQDAEAFTQSLTSEAQTRYDSDESLKSELALEAAFTNGAHSSTNTAGNDSPQADIVDQLGRVLLSVFPDLSFKAGLLEYFKGALGANTDSLQVLDKYNQVLVALNTDGSVSLGGTAFCEDSQFSEGLNFVGADNRTLSLTNLLTRLAELEDKAARRMGKFKQPAQDLVKTQNRVIFSLGQSLALGARAQPSVNTVQLYNNRMFAGGLKTKGGDLTSLVPLVEADDVNDGETCLSTLTNRLSQEDAYYAQGQTSYLVSAPAYAGRSIYTLSKGGEFNSVMVDELEAMAELSKAENTAVSMWFYTWTQGERDTAEETTKEVYKMRLSQYYSSVSFDARRLFSQAFSPKVILYQVGIHRRYGYDYPVIALAQKEWAEENGGLLACSMYQFDYYSGDNVHLTNDGEIMLGKYYGRAAQSFISKGSWAPLHCTKTSLQGKVVTATFYVPEGNLQFKTDRVAQALNFGFDILGEDKMVLDIIDSVSITDTDTVTIKLTQDLPEGASLVYAHGRPGDEEINSRLTGPRGNLCDSAGTTEQYQDEQDVTIYLDNYCVIFDEIIT